MGDKSKHTAVWLILVAVLSAPSVTRADDEALNPRNEGDWNRKNAPMQTYLHCHPALPTCQLPTRSITKRESDLNQRAIVGEDAGTPTRPLVPEEDALVGPEVGQDSSLNTTAVSGPAIKKRQ